MNVNSPYIFQPSFSHRVLVAILCACFWTASTRGLLLANQGLAKLIIYLNQSKTLCESTTIIWLWITVLIIFCIFCCCLLVFLTIFFIMVQATNIIVDDMGITIEYIGIPHTLAVYLGAGYLNWKHITKLEKNIVFFKLHGIEINTNNKNINVIGYNDKRKILLKFLVVDELEKLIFTILNSSPNIKL